MTSPSIDRRRFLGTALGAAVGLGGIATVASCSASTSSSEGSTKRGKVTLPTYVPYTGIKPDLPSLENGTSPFFANYPPNPPKFTDVVPGKGGTITTLTFLNLVQKQLDENKWWQAINAAVGAKIDIQGAAIGQYPARFQTMVASGEVNDLVAILPESTPDLGRLLKAKFQDMTDHLSGNAIKDYPGLANIPTYCWKNCVYNGGIYVLPIHHFSLKHGNLVRVDLAKKAGVNPKPANGDELHEMLKGLSDLRQNRWATNYVWGLLEQVAEMMGAPNEWKADGGKFIKDFETDEYVQALEFVRKCWSENIIHPSAFEANFSLKSQALFNAGTTAYICSGSTWSGNATQAKIADASAELDWFPVMKWDGSGPAKRWVGGGAPYLVAMKQSSPDRVKELLGVVNWLASPWGTKEFRLFREGVEGHDYTLDSDGKAVRTDIGKAERPAGLAYIGSSALVHSGNPYSQAEYESESDGMQNPDPLITVGLESVTQQNRGPQLAKQIQDAQSDIIQGRKPVSSWIDAVQTWRTSGGDKIRSEYQLAYQETGEN